MANWTNDVKIQDNEVMKLSMVCKPLPYRGRDIRSVVSKVGFPQYLCRR